MLKNTSIKLEENHINFFKEKSINRSAFIRNKISESDDFKRWKSGR